MQTFIQYAKIREQEETTPKSSSFEILEKIVKLVWDRYRAETKEFFVEIGKKDPEIKELVDKMDRAKEPKLDQGASTLPDERNPNVPQIVPPRADTAAGQDQQQD
jgi:hypothetical protein